MTTRRTSWRMTLSSCKLPVLCCKERPDCNVFYPDTVTMKVDDWATSTDDRNTASQHVRSQQNECMLNAYNFWFTFTIHSGDDNSARRPGDDSTTNKMFAIRTALVEVTRSARDCWNKQHRDFIEYILWYWYGNHVSRLLHRRYRCWQECL